MIVEDAIVNAARKKVCERNGLYFTRYFFKQRLGGKMIIGLHHALIQSALDRTMLPPSHPDFIPRLIINMPPGYTKTEMAAISYIARGIAIDPRNRFMHLSYSDALALQNSASAREIIKSTDYQTMWQVSTKDDSDAKSIWWTTEGGGVRAAAAGGGVTGFRAGHMEKDRFTGALIIDDPVKPDDADTVELEKVNNRYSQTVSSRVAVESNPIIVIMQRIHYNDLAGYLLHGGSGEKWHHLNLPVIIEPDYAYPKEYTHGIEIKHNLPAGWLWHYKHNEEHEVALRSHRRKFLSQYMQRPPKRDEDRILWTESMMRKAHENPFASVITRTLVSVDPAVSNTKTSDEHGILVGSKYGKNEYSIDADYTRKGTPKQWADAAIYAYEEHNADAIVIEINQGGDMCETTLRNAGFKGRIIKVHASKGKTARAEPIAALYELGYVWHHTGLMKLEDEMLDFDPVTGLSNNKSPNRVDAAVWLLTSFSKTASDFMIA